MAHSWLAGAEVREQHHHRARFGPIAMVGNRWCAVPVDDVVWRVEERVDPAPPGMSTTIRGRRELELEWLPIRIEDDVNGHSLSRNLCREGDAMRRRTPVRPVERDAMPGDVAPTDQLVQGHPLPLVRGVSQDAARVEHGHEP